MSLHRLVMGNALLSLLGMGNAITGAGRVHDPLPIVPQHESVRGQRIKGMMKKRSRRDAQRRRWNRRRMAKLSRRKNYQVLGRRG